MTGQQETARASGQGNKRQGNITGQQETGQHAMATGQSTEKQDKATRKTDEPTDPPQLRSCVEDLPHLDRLVLLFVLVDGGLLKAPGQICQSHLQCL